MNEVDAKNAERLLLNEVCLVEHAHVEDDVAERRARGVLKAQAHPAVRFVVAPEAAGGHSIRKDEELTFRADRGIKAFDEELDLVIEHRVEPRAADVAPASAVDGVAERHVVGGDRLGNRSGGTAHRKKPSRDFLAGPDLCKRPVELAIPIDLECLLAHLRIERRGHDAEPTMQTPRRETPESGGLRTATKYLFTTTYRARTWPSA